MTAPSCPNCRLPLHPLPLQAVWPGWYICDAGHRWKLPLALALAGMEPRPQPAPAAATSAWLQAVAPTGRQPRRPSRSAVSRPFWTR